MITSAEIELIGYVGKDPIFPKPNEYPNFVTFSGRNIQNMEDERW